MYALTTHSMSVKVALRDRAIAGSATATTFESSMINDEIRDAVNKSSVLDLSALLISIFCIAISSIYVNEKFWTGRPTN